MRDVICVPLVSLANINAQDTLAIASKSDTLGLIYLECHQETVVPELNLELLHTLAWKRLRCSNEPIFWNASGKIF